MPMALRFRRHAKRVYDVIDEGQTVAVQSSNLATVQYEEDEQLLTVQFNKGPVYQYYKVPESVVEGLMLAPSTGVYFNQHVRYSYLYARVAG